MRTTQRAITGSTSQRHTTHHNRTRNDDNRLSPTSIKSLGRHELLLTSVRRRQRVAVVAAAVAAAVGQTAAAQQSRDNGALTTGG